jgi:inhibitor of cysteine peptidase
MIGKSKKVAIRRGVIAVLLAVLVLVAGCGTSKEVKLDANDNGRQVELKKGQTLVLALESNPTTGYTWETVEPEEPVLAQKGEVEFKSESDLLGAGGVQTLRFEAVRAGQTDLKLVYHRPWEESVEPLETFSVQVTVR